MNKAELIDQIATEADLSKAAAGKALDAIFNSIGDALSKGVSVTIPSFGGFIVKERAARKGRNPKTGEVIDIKAAQAISFKVGKALKDKVQSAKK